MLPEAWVVLNLEQTGAPQPTNGFEVSGAQTRGKFSAPQTELPVCPPRRLSSLHWLP